MTGTEPDRLPGPLRAALERDDAAGFTVEVITVGADGWPHVALVSVGEIVALADPHVRLALWPSSTTTANLVRTRAATLAAVTDGVAYRVRVTVAPRGELEGPA